MKQIRQVRLLPGMLLALILTGYFSVSCQAISGNDKTEIRWFSDNIYWSPDFWEENEETKKAADALNCDLSVTYLIPEENGAAYLNLMIVSNDLPDLLSLSSTGMIASLIRRGLVWELTEFFETYLPESHLMTDYPRDLIEKQKEELGGLYSLCSDSYSPDSESDFDGLDPVLREINETGNANGIIWNKNLLRRLDIDINKIKDPEDILEVFELLTKDQITVNGNPVMPLLIDGTAYTESSLQVLAELFSYSRTDQEGAYREFFLSDACKNILVFLNTCIREGYLDQNAMTLTHYEVSHLLNAGEVLCFIGKIAQSGIDPENWCRADGLISGIAVCEEDVRTGTTYTLILKAAAQPEKTALFLDYLTTEEGRYLYQGEDPWKWWPLRDLSRSYHIAGTADAKDRAWADLLKGADEPVNRSVFSDLSEELWSGYSVKNNRIKKLALDKMTEIILSDSNQIFDRRYSAMLDELTAAGIYELQAEKNLFYQQEAFISEK